MRPMTWMAVLGAAGAVALAGCGGGDNESSSGSSGSSSSSGGGQTLKLAADPNGKIAFDKTELTAKSGQVTIDFSNSSGVPHAVEVEGKGVEKESKTITQGSSSVTVNLKPGKYEFYCPVDGHREQGMEGTLTVN